MNKTDKLFIRHILDSINQLEYHVKGISEDKFSKNVTIQDAVLRRLEIIGEASKNISFEFRKEHRNIDWRKVIGFRNVIVHQYFEVDIHIVWVTLITDIPVLKKNLESLLED